MRAIRVYMSESEVYDVPLKYIAQNRAKYYADLESRRGTMDYEQAYNEEFKFCMEDEYEGMDWFKNNMDWKDIADVAILVPVLCKPKDYEELFRNAEAEFVERV